MSARNLLLLVMLVFIPPFATSGQDHEQMKEEVSLTGKHLAVLEVALSELKKQGLDSFGYQITLYRAEKTYVVIFEDPVIAPGQRGASPDMPTYEIEIDDEYRVIRANFSR